MPVHYRIHDIENELTYASNDEWGYTIRYEKFECGLETVTIKHYAEMEFTGDLEIYTRHPNGEIRAYRETKSPLVSDIDQPGAYWNWSLLVHLATTRVDTIDEWFEMWKSHFQGY